MPHLQNAALGQGVDMLLELVAMTGAEGSEASVWRARQKSSGDQWASGWQPLGKPGRGGLLSLSVIQRRFDGRLEAFVIDSEDQAVWHSWQTDSDEGWSEWDLLGNHGGHHAQAAAAVTMLPDDRVMAVVVAGGTVWSVSPPHPEPSSFWPAWSSLGRPGGRAAGRQGGAGSRSRVPRRQPDRSGCARENPRRSRVPDSGVGHGLAPVADHRRRHALVGLGTARHARQSASHPAHAGGKRRPPAGTVHHHS